MATCNSLRTDTQDFFSDKDPDITEATKAIFVQYSGIPEEQVVPHIRAVRDKAWKYFEYPCIGLYTFLEFGIRKHERYAEVLERVRSGQTLLDLACCFGQDLRQLVFDGAPAENLTGTELNKEFVNLGYDLFNDREKFKAAFKTGDFFSPDVGLAEQSLDIIHAAAFFHLFSWDGQVDAMSKAVRLLKPKPGSILFGRQTSVAEAGTLKHPAAPQGEFYRHNLESFQNLVSEVAEKTGHKLSCDAGLLAKTNPQIGDAWKIMNFCITVK